MLNMYIFNNDFQYPLLNSRNQMSRFNTFGLYLCLDDSRIVSVTIRNIEVLHASSHDFKILQQIPCRPASSIDRFTHYSRRRLATKRHGARHCIAVVALPWRGVSRRNISFPLFWAEVRGASISAAVPRLRSHHDDGGLSG
jgi:hypothetical protein